MTLYLVRKVQLKLVTLLYTVYLYREPISKPNFLDMYKQMCLHSHILMHAFIYTNTCINACTITRTKLHQLTYSSTHAYTHTRACVSKYMCVRVCVCVRVYVANIIKSITLTLPTLRMTVVQLCEYRHAAASQKTETPVFFQGYTFGYYT